eukprot:TRINITY_DN9944_c0_g1_i3.p1 TRINITY_DN9944_c0_g1~~TRINITY_DN9944_c0_g1_i3.p1  ORF type:complete len:192 (+),score=26.29 TRINITY_DN9944_c0_g1_i3:62-637(+)
MNCINFLEDSAKKIEDEEQFTRSCLEEDIFNRILEGNRQNLFTPDLAKAFDECEEKFPEKKECLQQLRRVLSASFLFPKGEIALYLNKRSRDRGESDYSQSQGSGGRKISISATKLFNEWIEQNRHDPYPSMQVKQDLAKQTGLTVKQVQTWFTNRRARSCLSEKRGSFRKKICEKVKEISLKKIKPNNSG